jgi:short-subunit dehydrogenase
MIIITGASDGLGKELANLFKADGKKIVNISRTPLDFADENIIADFADEAQLKSAIRQLQALEGKIELFISNAGIYSSGVTGDMDYDDIQKVFRVNTFAPMMLLDGLIERIKADEADIAFVVSSVATKPSGEDVYGPSKWALKGYAQNLQARFKNSKTRVLAFFPGGFASSLFEKAHRVSPIDAQDLMRPGDVAKALKSQIDLPKNMETSEMIVNRK